MSGYFQASDSPLQPEIFVYCSHEINIAGLHNALGRAWLLDRCGTEPSWIRRSDMVPRDRLGGVGPRGHPPQLSCIPRCQAAHQNKPPLPSPAPQCEGRAPANEPADNVAPSSQLMRRHLHAVISASLRCEQPQC